MKRRKILAAVMAASLTGCATYTGTKVLELPQEPIHAMLIMIEVPSFSPTLQQKDGVATVNKNAQEALATYNSEFFAAVNRDMVRVFEVNGVASKIVFIPPQTSDTTNPLPAVKAVERGQWQYALWIRHTKGMANCQRGAGCTAFFQNEARVLNVASGKTMWNASADQSAYVNSYGWQNGQRYRFFLDNLNHDKMIVLPTQYPVIKIASAAK